MDKAVRKKRMITAIVIILAISVVGLVLLLIEDTASGDSKTASEDIVTLPEPVNPNWDENIYADEEWLGKNRYITYIDNGMSLTITDGEYVIFGGCVEFMAQYFDALMQGDASALCSFYDESYFDTHQRWDRITMQRVYDITLELISAVDSARETTYIYRVSYRIMKNDKTFRGDIESDGARAQYYTIVDDGNDIKITDVSYSNNQ